jgi:uncharacterized membrane protein
MKPMLKPILTALAGAALIAAPVAASAQTHSHSGGGSFHGGSSFRGASGFRGAPAFHGGGYRGGYYNRGYGYGGYALGGFGLGLALGAASAPWGYSGYYAPDYYDYPDTAYAAPPPAVCGNWAWNAGSGRYDWIPCR